MRKLHMFFEQQRVGTFLIDDALHMDFQYEEAWRQNPAAFPISLAMPLEIGFHKHPGPAIFLENLLPEQKIRRAIEQAHKFPSDNPYLFLKEFGEDLAGAFVISDQEQPPMEPRSRLVLLPHSTIQKAIEEGVKLYQTITDQFGAKFSLAGAQDKFCIIYQKPQLFVSLGKDPSTHIAKVNLDFSNSQTVFNEFFCMKLAEKVGLPVPEVNLIPELPLLLVTRYDRRLAGDQIQRLHQEDFCQIQGIASGEKYEDKGGPGIRQNYEILRRFSAQPLKDLEHLLDWIAFNLIIGNNDSHSKNISLLYQNKKVKLAPFYDLLSTSVYGKKFSPHFAFKIGRTMHYQDIRKADINALEGEIGVREGKFLKNMARVAAHIQKHVTSVEAELKMLAPGSSMGLRIHQEIDQRLTHFRQHGGLDI